ncbi:MAG: HAMP domain-containing protein [Candidatus Omnitrophica bacterium]|nr:HAMP domain-containing protein [Candidatus Omnitrophota bacterium]
MKIANKISAAFFIAALLFTVIGASVLYFNAKVILQEVISDNLFTAVSSRSAHIETYLAVLKSSVMQLSQATVLENILKVDPQDEQGREYFERAKGMLKKAVLANPSIAEFQLMDREGKVVVSCNEDNVGKDQSMDASFLGGQKGAYLKDVYYSKTYEDFLMSIAVPFTDFQTGEFLGVLQAKGRLNILYDIVKGRIGLGQTGAIYIVNKYGYLITPYKSEVDVILKLKLHNKEVIKAHLHEKKEHLLTAEKKIDITPDIHGVAVIGAHEYIPEMGWAVIAEIDEKEAFRPLFWIRMVFLCILFIIPLAGWLSGIFVARLVIGPINTLYKGTEIIDSGNLDYKVGTKSLDEVGQLSRAFDKMTAYLRNSTTSIDKLNKEVLERTKAQEEVNILAQRIEFILGATKTGIDIIDSDFNMKYIDSAWKKIYGDFEGKKCYEYFTDRDTACPGCAIRKAIEIKKPVISEEILPKEGNRPIQVTTLPFQDSDGRWMVAEVNVDISERKKAEDNVKRMLVQQQEMNVLQQKLLVPGTGSNKLKIITDGIVRILNVDFCRIWLINPGDLCAQGCVHAEVKEGSHVCRFRDRCLHLIASSGRYTHIDGKVHRRVPYGAYKIGLVASGEDRKFLTNDVLNDPRVHNHDWARELGLVSFAGYQISIQKGERLGVLALFSKYPVLPEEDALLDNISNTAAFVIQQSRGEEKISISLKQEIKSREIMASMLTDNNQIREELEKSLKRLREAQGQLIHAEKMEAVGRMASGVAHEVKNPLGIILQGINYFEGEFPPEAQDNRQMLQMMKTSLKRADGIVRALLNFSRAEELKTEPQGINTIIESSINLIKYRFSINSIENVCQLKENLPQVSVDRGKIEQVLINLLNNAMDAMPSGGKIYIRTYISEVKMPNDKVGARENDYFHSGEEAVFVEVEDTGTGIDQQNINKIFEPFFTTKDRTQGTGLGLSVAKSIVEMHNGLFIVESTKGKGTKFTIVLKIHGRRET